MPRFVLIAMNGATPDGDEQALERWYEDVHIPDLLSVPGITSARRFRTVGGSLPAGKLWPYVAVYEIEADDLGAVNEGMRTNLRPFHPDFDHSRSTHIFAVQISGDE